MSDRAHAASAHDERNAGARAEPEPGAAGRAQALHQAAGNQAAAALFQGESPLDPAARAALEHAYGVDLGHVRVHSGPEATDEARSRGALAFTRGGHVYLGDAAGEPRVVRHELTHVLQQTGGGDNPALSADALEQEAASGGDASVGAASPGSVQKLDLFGLFGDDDEKKAEQQKRDSDTEQLVAQLGVISKSTVEWKKWIDHPEIGPWMRRHPGAFGPPGSNPEFERWAANPGSRPTGAPAADVKPPPQIRQAEGAPPAASQAPTELERRHKQVVWNRMSATEKAAFVQAEREEKWRRYVASVTPEKGSVGEAVETLGEMTGASNIKRAITGRTKFGQRLDWDERIGEAIYGPAKLVATVGSLALGMPEFGAAGEAGVAAPELLGTEAIPLGADVAPMEDVLEPISTPTGTAEEAQARAQAFEHSDVVDPGRAPRGLETGRFGPGQQVKAGGLEDVESTFHPRARTPRSTGLTEAEQLAGIEMEEGSAAKAAREEFNPLQPEYAEQLHVQQGGQVHHAIELQTLDRYPGVFDAEELNSIENMRGIPPEEEGLRQFHNSKIRYEWDRHYDMLDGLIEQKGLQPGSPEYNAFVRQYLVDARAEMDELFGQFFSEYRAQHFPESVGLAP